MHPVPFGLHIDKDTGRYDEHRASSLIEDHRLDKAHRVNKQGSDAFDEDRENNIALIGNITANGVGSPDQQRPRQTRGVLQGSVNSSMTPTGLVSTSASSLPSNWVNLALKGRTEALRERQRKMSNPSSQPAEQAAAPAAAASQSEQQFAASQQVSTSQVAPAIKAEPLTEPLSPADASQAADVAEPSSTSMSAPLAGGLVGLCERSTAIELTATDDAPASTAMPISVPASASIPAPTTIAALSSATSTQNARSEGDALRTEIMGPPPSLPVDPAYPPLNSVLTDTPVLAPNPKRRSPTTAANGTLRKPAPLQAPDDFVPPTNLNGKMPYALFQTVKKTPPAGTKDSSRRYVFRPRSAIDNRICSFGAHRLSGSRQWRQASSGSER